MTGYMGNYILDRNGNAVPEPDFMKWGRWYEKHDRTVDRTQVGETLVSTVFLGLDHNWTGEGPPVLWETMTFGGKHEEMQWRYASEHAARRGHLAVVDALRHGLRPPEDICDGQFVITVGGERMEAPCRLPSGHSGNHKAQVGQ